MDKTLKKLTIKIIKKNLFLKRVEVKQFLYKSNVVYIESGFELDIYHSKFK